MASKKELLEQAVGAGLLPEDASEEDFSKAQLEEVLSTDVPAWEGSLTAQEPIVAPDGHVVLSQEDIDARNT